MTYSSLVNQKKDEWKRKGYSEELIEEGLKWADKWCKGITRRFVKDPVMRAQIRETLYPEALALSERFLEAMSK